MNSHLIIHNRAPVESAGGWIHIVPKGELPNRDAGVVQVLDDAAFDSILAGIEADRARLGANWPGVYAGREHHIYNADQDSAALAWFKVFEKRDNGIWAKDDGLTDIGREAIVNKRYKFTSFVTDRKDTAPLGDKRVRILKIDTIGFTNQANGKELLTPINNRKDTMPTQTELPSQKILNGDYPGHEFHGNQYADADSASASRDSDTHSSLAEKHSETAMAASKSARTSREHTHAAQAHQTAHDYHKTAANAARAEGDKETAAYHNKVAAGHKAQASFHEKQSERVKNRFPGKSAGELPKEPMKDIAKLLGLSEDAAPEAVSEAITTLQNRASRAAELETENQTLRAEQIDAELAAAGVKDEKVLNRLRPILADLARFKNREERAGFLADVLPKSGPAAPAGRVLNRGAGKPPVAAEPDTEAGKVEKIRNRAAELNKGGLGKDLAWAQAVAEVEAAK